MSALLISYDLRKPGQNHDKLYEKIKELGAWWHGLDVDRRVLSEPQPGVRPTEAFTGRLRPSARREP
jgi:hypothetical protein